MELQQSEQRVVLRARRIHSEKGIISYLTPVGQSLLNRKPAEEVEVPVEGGKKRYRIDTIAPFKPA